MATDDPPKQRYTPSLANEIEHKWQERWDAEHTFWTPNREGLLAEDPRGIASRPHLYVLDMFPYPSGIGLHVGHPLGYIATDVYARFQRMNGRNVLHAMGYDAFGLPAEQYAVQTGTHPRVTTEQNIATMTRQMRALGLGHDPRRGIATTDVSYYRWTQWIFLQIYNSWYDDDAARARPVPQLVQEFRAGRFATPNDIPFDDLGPREQRTLIDVYRLAYVAEAAVNWCPGLGTVLANEEVTSDGRSERGNFPVYRRPLKQWMLRITVYADRLLDDLDVLDWSDSVKLMQRNWIGRSTGASVSFPVAGHTGLEIEVFTTRPDTLFGATYMVLAPEHPLVDVITANEWPGDDIFVDWESNPIDAWKGVFGLADRPPDAVRRYREFALAKTDLERQAEGTVKSGVFTGAFAINPTNNDHIPIFVADYVLMGYGTGAIMAVPAHDQRDFEFAREFELPIVPVIRPSDDWLAAHVASPSDTATWTESYVGDGVAQNSANDDVSLDGLRVDDAERVIIAWLERTGLGRATVTYKLRDWLFSRQRYWGEPFPIVYDEIGPVAVPESMLPVVLPEVTDFEPKTSDDPDESPEPPLARATDWVEVELDLAGPAWAGYGRGRQVYVRETNTMPQWAGSCWYYLRYLDPTNEDEMVDRAVEQEWADGTRDDGSAKAGIVDLYVGGVEHAVLHLLYARFWHKVLFDLGHVTTPRAVPAAGQSGLHPCAGVPRRTGAVRRGRRSRNAWRAVLPRRQGGHARGRKDGQEPEELGVARRRLPRIRRRHVASLRDVHGPARQGAAVEHLRHRGRPPIPAAAVAKSHRRRDRRDSCLRRRRRRRDAPPAAPHDRSRARRHGHDELQHRHREAVRVEQPLDHGRGARRCGAA